MNNLSFARDRLAKYPHKVVVLNGPDPRPEDLPKKWGHFARVPFPTRSRVLWMFSTEHAAKRFMAKFGGHPVPDLTEVGG